jgi:predicted PurR-regulated permease PerM
VATLMVLVLLGLVIFPLSFLPASFEGAAEGIASVTNNWTELKLPPPPSWVSSFPLFGPMINERWAAAASNSLFQWLAAQGGSLGLTILEILLSIIFAGIFLTTVEGTTSVFHKIANRLGGASAENLLEVAVRTVRSVA